MKSKAGEQRNWAAPIVTQIEPAQTFYEAEDYHQQYLEKRGQVELHSGATAARRRRASPAPRRTQPNRRGVRHPRRVR